MAHVAVTADVDLDAPTLVDGSPGVGLVGKLVTDHLVETFDMTYYAGVYCEGVPSVATYDTNDSTVRPAIRLYADEERDLLALRSEVPVSPDEAPRFAACLVDWFAENDVTPLCLGGLVREGDLESREVYGLATGDGDALLDRGGIVPPADPGVISGPTGAILHRAAEVDLDGAALVAECEPRVSDPEAARVLIEHGIEPVLDVEVDLAPFVERAEEVRRLTEALAEDLNLNDEESTTQARPVRMFQ